jgi:hypothetical protein
MGFNQPCLIAWLPILPVMLKTDDYLPNWAVVTCRRVSTRPCIINPTIVSYYGYETERAWIRP